MNDMKSRVAPERVEGLAKELVTRLLEGPTAWDENAANALAAQIKEGVRLPFVKAYVSTLGGPERASVMFTLSFDPRESWKNGILENSRYFKMRYGSDQRLTAHSGGHGLPKFRAKRLAPDQVVPYLNQWIQANITESNEPTRIFYKATTRVPGEAVGVPTQNFNDAADLTMQMGGRHVEKWLVTGKGANVKWEKLGDVTSANESFLRAMARNRRHYFNSEYEAAIESAGWKLGEANSELIRWSKDGTSLIYNRADDSFVVMDGDASEPMSWQEVKSLL